MNDTLDRLNINTLRFLAVDAVEKAKSGHPGAPLGAAAIMYTLWDRFLKHNPLDPRWADRDRFVLSAGHASAMLYATLHLTGYDLTLEDLKRFRQWDSRTPGHPEYGLTPGVEATTGPLGQGVANAVGMAMAEKWLAQHYNRPGLEIINHRTYALVSDGDLQEGVASEAASLAGKHQLNKLTLLYDDNKITIEGSTDLAFTEDVGLRFQAYGWKVIYGIDGLDVESVDAALKQALGSTDRPTLLICRTTIGYGSPHKAGTAAAHGEPLGEEEVRLTKASLGWTFPQPFTVPEEVKAHFRLSLTRGPQWQKEWQQKLSAYETRFPDEAVQLKRDLAGDLQEDWDSQLASLFAAQSKPISTRSASGLVMNAIAQKVHGFSGGSADLAPSTKTNLKDRFGGTDAAVDHNLHFGIREHAMGAVANGMALHGGLIPFTGTFLIFYDYMRPAIRLAALSGIRVIYVFSHDSVGLGEDGPTHQPVEQLLGLRSVPNLVTIRPADAPETAEAWKAALERKIGPTAVILTRQDLPVLDRNALAPAILLQKGAYVLWDSDKEPEIILLASGSEVCLALEAGRRLQQLKIKARVVSMPSWELFNAQPADYRNQVLPRAVRKRISIEAGTTLGWQQYVGLDGTSIGIDRFGASAPGPVLYEKFGLTVDNIVTQSLKVMARGAQ